MNDLKLFENKEKNGQILSATTIMKMWWFGRYNALCVGLI